MGRTTTGEPDHLPAYVPPVGKKSNGKSEKKNAKSIGSSPAKSDASAGNKNHGYAEADINNLDILYDDAEDDPEMFVARQASESEKPAGTSTQPNSEISEMDEGNGESGANGNGTGSAVHEPLPPSVSQYSRKSDVVENGNAPLEHPSDADSMVSRDSKRMGFGKPRQTTSDGGAGFQVEYDTESDF